MTIEYKKTTLSNGLRIQAEVDSSAQTAACGFFVRTGSRDEDPGIMGVSHYLEHMIFKGTETRTADDVNREFDEIGATYNAFTSNETTAFWAHILPEHLPKTIDILTDIMRPSLRSNDLEMERGVILEEIAMYRDIPFWRLYDETMEAYYRSHPLSHRVLGTDETVTNLPHEDMVAYFNERYSADNTTFVMAGNLDFEAMVQEIHQRCSHWTNTQTHREFPSIEYGSSEVCIEDDKTSKHYLLMITPGPPIQDDRRYAADMLAHLIGDQEGSLLYWTLVDPGIAEEAQVGYDGRDGLGDFYVYASCPPERAEEVERLIDDQITRCLDLVTDDDLERLRSKIATQVTLSGERPAGRMRRLGQLGTYNLPYTTLAEELTRIQSVTLDDVRAVYEAFPFTPRTIGRLMPRKGTH